MLNSLLKENIISNTQLNSKELELVISKFEKRILKEGEFFLEIGQRCKHVLFIESGLVRIFYPNDKGDDTTCYFAMKNEFITSFTSFTTQMPSSENIQAILPTECFIISKEDLEELYHTIPETQNLGRVATERIAMLMEGRISLFLNHSAEERYDYLMKKQPLLLKTVPLNYLASYIGITPQHMSRLRKNYK